MSSTVFREVKECYNLSEHVNSHGILDDKGKHNINDYLSNSLPVLEMQMAVVLMTSHAFHFLLSRIGLSRMYVPAMLTGVLLGPSVLGKSEFMQTVVFPPSNQDNLRVISLMGIQFFTFITAVKMEIEVIRKAGRKEISLGISSVAVPVIVGYAYKTLVNSDYEQIQDTVVIKEQSIGHFPIPALLLSQLKLSNSELGRLVLSSALIADILSFATTITACLIGRGAKGCKSRDITGLVFMLIAAFALRSALLWLIRRNPRGKAINDFSSCMIYAMFVVIGIFYIQYPRASVILPYIFGFAVPSGPPIGSALEKKFETLTLGVFLPIQMAVSLMRADFGQIVTGLGTELQYFIGLYCLLFAVKWTACVVPSLIFKMPVNESFALGFIMSCKGVTELSSYITIKDAKSISVPVMSLGILYVLLSSIISPVLVKYLYCPSKKYETYRLRNVESSKPESKLGIVTCIHKPEDTASVFRVIDTIHPTKESPVSIYVLHLIELLGRSTPVFIAHEKNKPVTDHEYSQHVVVNFEQYEQKHPNVISVDTFTAISPGNLMDEDVCSLAFRSVASLILIPLHRMWAKGKPFADSTCMSSKDFTLHVLQKAPCSVAIFLDRSLLGYQAMKATKGSFQSLCLIFIGGNDDREALCIAMRMTQSNVHTRLTVVHLIHELDDVNSLESPEKVLDVRALRKVCKTSATDSRVVYARQVVKDGPEAALVIHSLGNEFDLCIVGRRYGVESPQTKGLLEWSECPEIGDVGDLLASNDINIGASVLIVQQQRVNHGLEM
ncbi:Cation/hydrogen exchanger family protein [Euphorbia peplus]|nr:Cation/hydrogen exchanger family protein [Euphorbia peplus]